MYIAVFQDFKDLDFSPVLGSSVSVVIDAVNDDYFEGLAKIEEDEILRRDGNRVYEARDWDNELYIIYVYKVDSYQIKEVGESFTE